MPIDDVTDAWQIGDQYEEYIGRWSRRVAPLFLAWLGMPAGRRWLDVGCGTGALTSAIWEAAAPSALTGVEPSEGFLRTARERLPGPVALLPGDATRIPMPDDSVDVVVSGLVLNFVPDPVSALREMTRVTVDGGTVAAYVWDYAEGMQLIRIFWDTAAGVDPRAALLDEGLRFPGCRPDSLVDLFTGAGLIAVESTPLEIPTPFDSFEAYWSSFLGGQGPAPSYVASLTDEERERLRESVRDRVPAEADGSIRLRARAWGVRGEVSGSNPRSRS
jgi:SAM-dependent methyltransferase